MEFFEIMQGQCVQLLRGGPEMIIKSINSKGICCTWYDTLFQKHRTGVFSPDDIKVFSGDEAVGSID